MILHDRVTVVTREQYYDDYGTPLWRDGPPRAVPAEVRPMTSEESDTTTIVETRYKVFLPPTEDGLTAQDKISWRGQPFEVLGDYEPHLVGGRLHHLEVVVRRRA